MATLIGLQAGPILVPKVLYTNCSLFWFLLKKLSSESFFTWIKNFHLFPFFRIFRFRPVGILVHFSKIYSLRRLLCRFYKSGLLPLDFRCRPLRKHDKSWRTEELTVVVIVKARKTRQTDPKREYCCYCIHSLYGLCRQCAVWKGHHKIRLRWQGKGWPHLSLLQYRAAGRQP